MMTKLLVCMFLCLTRTDGSWSEVICGPLYWWPIHEYNIFFSLPNCLCKTELDSRNPLITYRRVRWATEPHLVIVTLSGLLWCWAAHSPLYLRKWLIIVWIKCWCRIHITCSNIFENRFISNVRPTSHTFHLWIFNQYQIVSVSFDEFYKYQNFYCQAFFSFFYCHTKVCFGIYSWSWIGSAQNIRLPYYGPLLSYSPLRNACLIQWN